MHVQIALFDGFDPLDVIGPYEVLHAGGTATRGAVSVELASAEGPREVTSGTGGLALRATAALDPERADVIVVPGASGRVGAPGEAPQEEAGTGEPRRDAGTRYDPRQDAGTGDDPGQDAGTRYDPGQDAGTGDDPGQDAGTRYDPGQEASVPELLGRTLTTGLPALLRQAMDDPEVTVATVCGGSLVLAMAGLLEHRHATTHHLGLDLLDAAGAHAVHARVVDDGDLISGAGVTSGLDLALYLLERETGPRIAHAVEELFAHDRRGTVWRARGPVPAAL
ncbi:DJ-1/PfpI family protein [Streptomyces sp. NPDC014802]|uniref:DJ-1/PfpI family protein n=1 Tax=Streptomyces sp. NPDC014802 TaxID=3364917 RepID=UPI0036FA7C8F